MQWRNNESGFTLLETLIAMAIMVVAFSSILMVESGSLDASFRAKQLNIVSMLARNTLIETELLIENKAFSEVKTEESGNYADPYQEFMWKREIKEVEFPSLNTSGGDKQQDNEDPNAKDAGNSIAKLITQFLSKSIREIVVTVSYKKGPGEQKYQIAMYWVNLNNDFSLSQ